MWGGLTFGCESLLRQPAWWSLSFKDKLRVMRTLMLAQIRAHQKIQPYQKLRYGSNTPFRHGPSDIVKYSATPLPDNPAHLLQKGNSNALQDELGPPP